MFRLISILFFSSDERKICVIITTGTSYYDPGYLVVKMGNAVSADVTYHEKGSVVIDSCVVGLTKISLTNPKSNAWTGKISIEDAGRPTSLVCTGCEGKPYFFYITVDGNSDSGDLSNTHCFGGKTCTITWEIRGN